MLVAPKPAITYQGLNYVTPSTLASSISCAVPSPVNPGDILILMSANCWASKYATPSGWTLLATDTNTGADATSGAPADIGIGFYYKISNGTEAGTTVTTTQTTTGSASAQMGILRYSATAPTAVTAATTRSGTTASKTSPAPTAFTGTLATDLIVRVWAAANHTKGETTFSFAQPTGWTGRYGAISTGSANYVSGVVIADRIAATDNPTITSTSSTLQTWVTAGCRLSLLSSQVIMEQGCSPVLVRATW